MPPSDAPESMFLAACRGETTARVPVWFMRQAGRSLPEYRALREKHSILEMCRDPEIAAEVTLQPLRRYDVDAAILFSDIVVPLQAVGIALDIKPDAGPVVDEPVRDARGVRRLRALDPVADVPFVLEAVHIVRRELEVPLIGFAGAPFTLASYLVEGGPSKNHARTKALMLSEPRLWADLMERLSEVVFRYLRAQVEAGAHAVQLFDSWAGHLAPGDYRRSVLPHVERIVRGLDEFGAPRILFGVGTGELLGLMASTGTEVVGVDWRVPLDRARERTGGAVALQGNLDPSTCLAPWDVVAAAAHDVLRRGGGTAHVFNLGHGVLPDTDPGVLARLCDLVHSWTPRDAG